ncbi:MAG: leucine-rich repeat domain-containing protein [Wujia sp.]
MKVYMKHIIIAMCSLVIFFAGIWENSVVAHAEDVEQLKENLFMYYYPQKEDYQYFLYFEELENGDIILMSAPSVSEAYIDVSMDIVLPDTINGKTVTSLATKYIDDKGNIASITIPETLINFGELNELSCEKLIIKSKISTIPDQFCYNNKEIREVVLPDTVEEIGMEAFRGCNALETINMPSGLKKIGECAFGNCAIKSMSLPLGLTAIENLAFYDCNNLESITIPNSVTEFGTMRTDPSGYWYADYGVFTDCENLKTVSLPSDLKELPKGTFQNCTSLTKVYMPSKLTAIHESCFRNCTSMEDIELPDTLTAIDAGAFYYCKSLTKIELPDTITSLGAGTPIGSGSYGVFTDCSNLTEVKLPSSIDELPKYIFSGCRALNDVTMPENLTRVGNYCFWGCVALQKLDLPSSVVSIGEGAFCRCSSLKAFTIPENVETLGEDLFNGCSQIQELAVPEKVTQIPAGFVAYNSSLTKLVLMPTVISIDEDACYDVQKSGNEGFPENMVIYCHTGSCAETFAKDNEIPYENIHFYDSNNECPYCATVETEHTYVIEITKEASCTEAGVATYVCSGCGDVKEEPIAPLGHSWDAGTVTKPATLTETGIMTYTCTVCGVTKTETIPMKSPEKPEQIITATSSYEKTYGDSGFNLDVALLEGDGDITYASSDTNVVTVSASGRVVIKGAGVATITVAASETEEYKQTESMVTITVAKAVQTLSGTTTYQKKTTSAAFSLDTQLTDGDGTLTYASSNSSVVTVSEMGVVTIQGAGNAVITVTATETANYLPQTYTVAITVETDTRTNPGNGDDEDDENGQNQSVVVEKPKAGAILTDKKSGSVYKVVKQGSVVEYSKPVNTAVTSVTVPATVTINQVTYKVTSIAKNAFKGCKKLKTVKLGANITTIGANAFYGCSKLTSVTLNAKLTTIGDKAFSKCTALAKITIPANVTKIGKQAFYGDKKLATITIKTNKLKNSKVGSKAFGSIHTKATVKVPKAKINDYKKMLKSKGLGSKAKVKS